MLKGIKKIIKLALQHDAINFPVRDLLRFCLQSSTVSFSLKKMLEDRVAWGIPAANIADFTIRCFDNKKIRMSGPITSPELRDLYWWGLYAFEYETSAIFWKLAKRAKVFFDVGANIGYYSLLGAKANPELKICAFEPVSEICQILRNNISLNGFVNIVVEDKAITDETQMVQIFVPSDNITSASTNRDFHVNEKRYQREVVGIRLDDYISQERIPMPDLIKIDVETAEIQVLKGMRNILENAAPIIICEVLGEPYGSLITEFLSPLGYKFYFIADSRLIRMDEIRRDDTIEWKSKQKTPFNNFLFAKIDCRNIGI
jgi:FkbM family methyltransferase